jgi:hypothetical protein
MVNQRRLAAGNSLYDPAGDPRKAYLQPAAATFVRRLRVRLPASAQGGLPLGLPCWDIQGVDEDALDPVFWDMSRGRAAQKARFLGEFFPAQLPEGATGKAFMDFFQVNKLTGEPKGMLAIRLRGGQR